MEAVLFESLRSRNTEIGRLQAENERLRVEVNLLRTKGESAEIKRLQEGRDTMGNLWAKEKAERHRLEADNEQLRTMQQGYRDQSAHYMLENARLRAENARLAASLSIAEAKLNIVRWRLGDARATRPDAPPPAAAPDKAD